jgi:hypothetical protein
MGMCNILLHLSHYSIPPNVIFTAYTLSPTVPNCPDLLQQMDSVPSQVRNHYLQGNEEAHLERAHAFKRAANLHFQLCAFVHHVEENWYPQLH